MSFPNDNLSDQSSLYDFEKEYSIYFSPFSQLSMNDSLEEENEFPPQYFRPIIERSEGEKKSTEISAPYFITSYLYSGKKSRGRKVASEKKYTKNKRHLPTDEDNILTKIQVHFLKFLIYFLNDCLFDYYKKNKICFKKFAHKVTSKVSSNHFNKMKNSTIYDILTETPISTKYKDNKNTNIELANDLNQIDWFHKLFGLKFMELFYVYYNERKQLQKIFLFNREILLSNDTKSYYFLLEKNKKENRNIIEITENNYPLKHLDKDELAQKIRAYS